MLGGWGWAWAWGVVDGFEGSRLWEKKHLYSGSQPWLQIEPAWEVSKTCQGLDCTVRVCLGWGLLCYSNDQWGWGPLTQWKKFMPMKETSNQPCVLESLTFWASGFFFFPSVKMRLMKAALCICDDKMRSKEWKHSISSKVSEKFLLVRDYRALFTPGNSH